MVGDLSSQSMQSVESIAAMDKMEKMYEFAMEHLPEPSQWF